MIEWLQFAQERSAELWLRTGEHLLLTGVSTVVAAGVGVPLGLWVSVARGTRGAVLGAVGILQTIPSLAMLVLLLALFDRIGVLPALVALVLYALLPIVRNTVTGIDEVAPELVEAARGVGMTRAQELLWVRVPLALPVILAGIRTAAVIGVGIATLSAFIGAGGLGEFINRGLALADTDLILLGAIPAGVLAIAVDVSLAGVQVGLSAPRVGRPRARRRVRRLALTAPVPLVVLGIVAYRASVPMGDAESTVVVGSKNFTEQLVLGEIMAQMIEAHTDLEVRRRFNLGGTMICHEALVRGEIDVYAEYTGTALTSVLGAEPVSDPEEAFERVEEAYAARFAVEWLPPLGFDNTYVAAVRADVAEGRGWERISDVSGEASTLVAGMTAEFAERPDGLPGLEARYGLGFGELRSLDPGLMYEAVARGEVDLIFAFATDARLEAHDLRTLEDDRSFFPPYEAAPAVRAAALERHPGLRASLERLAGQLPDSAMRRLNHRVDVRGDDPADVARLFLRERGLSR